MKKSPAPLKTSYVIHLLHYACTRLLPDYSMHLHQAQKLRPQYIRADPNDVVNTTGLFFLYLSVTSIYRGQHCLCKCPQK